MIRFFALQIKKSLNNNFFQKTFQPVSSISLHSMASSQEVQNPDLSNRKQSKSKNLNQQFSDEIDQYLDLHDTKDFQKIEVLPNIDLSIYIPTKLQTAKTSQTSQKKYQTAENKIYSDIDEENRPAKLIYNQSLQNRPSKLVRSLKHSQNYDLQNVQQSIQKNQSLKNLRISKKIENNKIRDAFIKQDVEKRVSNANQSKTQLLLLSMSGYYYTRNFKQFYNRKLSIYFQNQQAYYLASTQKKLQAIDKIIINDTNTININICNKAKQKLLKLFEQQDQRKKIEQLYHNLFQRAYISILETQKRRIMNQSIQDGQQNTHFLDLIGQNELYQLFNQEYDKLFSKVIQQQEKIQNSQQKQNQNSNYQSEQDKIKKIQYRNIFYKLKLF